MTNRSSQRHKQPGRDERAPAIMDSTRRRGSSAVAAILEKEDRAEEEELIGTGVSAEEDDSSDNTIWASLDVPALVTIDPAAGLRLLGSKPRFWDTGTPSLEVSAPTSPSTASLANRAKAAGISGSDLQ